jgi:hypothetical protein
MSHQPRNPEPKAPTSPKALEKDAAGMKERWAEFILQQRRLLRLADTA